jgi:zinc protease
VAGERLETRLNLVAESVLQPTFPTVELNKFKAQVQSALGAQDDDPMSAASRLLRRLYFGNHPYGRSALGTEATGQNDFANRRDEVLEPDSQPPNHGHRDLRRRGTRRKSRKARAFLFGNFRAKTALPAAPARANAPTKFVSQTIQKPGLAQAAMWFGFPSIDVKGADRYAIDVLDAAMSGASLPGGRLHARLRDAELVYVVHAYNSPGLEPGMFVIYAASTKANRARAQSIIEAEIARVRQGGISPAELERAKSMSISAHAIENQTNAAWRERPRPTSFTVWARSTEHVTPSAFKR